MSMLSEFHDGFNRWIDSVARTICAATDRLRAKRHVRVIEEDDDTFVLHVEGEAGRRDAKQTLPDHRIRIADGRIETALPPGWVAMLRGSRTDLVLQPRRFLYRPLELPKRAAEFLDGIVRSQVDRLTPWTADEAVFGWTAPADAASDRIVVTVAATARALVMPYVQALAQGSAATVAVLTHAAGAASPVTVFEHRARGALEVARIRSALVATFVATGLAAALSMGYAAIAADDLDAQQQALSRKVAARRAALRAGPEFTYSAQRMLERRKQTTPSTVMVLEALSEILPDHTYVTELHVEGDKLQVAGITRDAPALIALIEQSAHFTHATFNAPTTRTAGEPGERFHIEAHIKPIFAVGI